MVDLDNSNPICQHCSIPLRATGTAHAINNQPMADSWRCENGHLYSHVPGSTVWRDYTQEDADEAALENEQ